MFFVGGFFFFAFFFFDEDVVAGLAIFDVADDFAAEFALGLEDDARGTVAFGGRFGGVIGLEHQVAEFGHVGGLAGGRKDVVFAEEPVHLVAEVDEVVQVLLLDLVLRLGLHGFQHLSKDA